MAAKALTDAQKSSKFKELGEIRLNRALAAINGLRKLANKKRYKYTDGQVKILKDSFEAALDDCFAAFDGKTVASGKVEL
jgi:hypothetical protein